MHSVAKSAMKQKVCTILNPGQDFNEKYPECKRHAKLAQQDH
jgi:hypothetical protein